MTMTNPSAFVKRQVLMKARVELGALLSASVIGISLPVDAQTTRQPGALHAAEQQEADYRVIAARCGTPAFEKGFFKDSRAAVAAGLVNKNRMPADVEKTVEALRRSPFVLVASNADCPSQLAQLKELQKARKEAIRTGRPRRP
ncbi:hypothetical protein H4CHR_02051 [Variovorax sp. PBS-H4]|uniref:hypothetical protein n=1 Tax=Variovorax sp. PBS-H4 TaxID=434008 RepID=UPI0013193759|nr:hypothetical protein [Variovorax sp. PBS-H4]VTU27696.1 hypothetical protein H4CHR_02051 [Variovorax sp. PBS-H4]